MSDSLDPSQSLPERFGSGETVPDAYGERDDSCIICNLSDISVFRCSGTDCPVWFHEECLNPEFGGNENISDPFCPYCRYKFVLKRCETLREMAIEAKAADSEHEESNVEASEEEERLAIETLKEMAIEAKKAGVMYLTKSSDELTEIVVSVTLSGEEELLGEKAVDSSNEEERLAIETFQDEKDDEETSEVQTNVSTCALKLGDVSIQESSSGIEHDQVQQSEKHSGSRLVQLSGTSSSKERSEEDVTEQIGSSLSVEMNNQQNENRSRRRPVELSDTSSSKERNEEDVTKEIGSSSSVEMHNQQNENRSRRIVVQVTDTSSVTEQIGSSSSGAMNNQQNENQSSRRVVQLSDASSSTERNEEDFIEQIGSSLSGEMHNQQNENQSRRRVVQLSDISSSKDRIKEDITEQIGSSSSGEVNNQQSKLNAAMSATVRTLPSVFYNKQRRRVLWTSEEEETLMEGVEIFAAEAKKNIPWRKILERGANVFHESRSSSDLKDKWRNMLKAAARLEH